MSEQELNGIEIVRDGNGVMIAMIPLKLTESKLQVLLTVAKALGIDLSQLIEGSVWRIHPEAIIRSMAKGNRRDSRREKDRK